MHNPEGIQETPEETWEKVRSQVQTELSKFDRLVGSNPQGPFGNSPAEVEFYIEDRYAQKQKSALHWKKLAEEMPEDPVAILEYIQKEFGIDHFPLSSETFKALLAEAKMPSVESLLATMPTRSSHIRAPGELFYQIAHWAGGCDKVPEYIANGGAIGAEERRNKELITNQQAKERLEKNKVEDTEKRVRETLKKIK